MLSVVLAQHDGRYGSYSGGERSLPRAANWPQTELAYTVRRRRLSSITLAPWRNVIGVPGQRWQAA
jgi:hypothetical protein